jgi:hypothetical protein
VSERRLAPILLPPLVDCVFDLDHFCMLLLAGKGYGFWVLVWSTCLSCLVLLSLLLWVCVDYPTWWQRCFAVSACKQDSFWLGFIEFRILVLAFRFLFERFCCSFRWSQPRRCRRCIFTVYSGMYIILYLLLLLFYLFYVIYFIYLSFRTHILSYVRGRIVTLIRFNYLRVWHKSWSQEEGNL